MTCIANTAFRMRLDTSPHQEINRPRERQKNSIHSDKRSVNFVAVDDMRSEVHTQHKEILFLDGMLCFLYIFSFHMTDAMNIACDTLKMYFNRQR